MIGFFIALLSGALMSVQGVFNTEVTKVSSMWTIGGLGAVVGPYYLPHWPGALTDRKNPLTVFRGDA